MSQIKRFLAEYLEAVDTLNRARAAVNPTTESGQAIREFTQEQANIASKRLFGALKKAGYPKKKRP